MPQPPPATETVERSLVLPADAAEVWDALVDPELLARWFDGAVQLDPVDGGRVRVDGTEPRWGVVRTAVPGELLAWWWAGEEGPASEVAILLEPDAAGTRVTVRERRMSCTVSVVGTLLGTATPGSGAPVAGSGRGFGLLALAR